MGDRTCAVDQCAESVRCKGLCRVHYEEHRKAELAKLPCSVEGCPRPMFYTRAKLCVAHYQRQRAHGDVYGGGPTRSIRGDGLSDWAVEQRRRDGVLPDASTIDYVDIIQDDPCVYCGQPTGHIDHIIPRRDGGPTVWENLAPTCAGCNYAKHTKSVLGFMLRRVTEGGDADDRADPHRLDSA